MDDTPCINPGSLQFPSTVTVYNGPIQSIEEGDDGSITPSALLTPIRSDDTSQISSSPSPNVSLITNRTSPTAQASPHHSPVRPASAAPSHSDVPTDNQQRRYLCVQHYPDCPKSFSSEKDLQKHLITKEHRPDLYRLNVEAASERTHQCTCGRMMPPPGQSQETRELMW
ncbi:hypothetical protein PG993_011402 [Apiospora rasikravindrae]|uniref:C2H2-type domain-containing protein n=1 Tax=Apiospora rasikravindrae TaxID=990691 RepID=A0ABR1SE48_9PEZI